MIDAPPSVYGVILAGGQARRMGGGDKFLLPLKGKPLLGHVIERAAPQTRGLILNANGDPARLAGFGLPVIPDPIEGHAGPLAGILAGLDWLTREQPGSSWLVSLAADTPFIPRDLVARLLDAVTRDQSRLVCAASGGRSHPVIGLWPLDIMEDLRHALIDEGLRKIDLFTVRYPLSTVEFDAYPIDPFFNANRPEDLVRAKAMLSETVP